VRASPFRNIIKVILSQNTEKLAEFRKAFNTVKAFNNFHILATMHQEPRPTGNRIPSCAKWHTRLLLAPLS